MLSLDAVDILSYDDNVESIVRKNLHEIISRYVSPFTSKPRTK